MPTQPKTWRPLVDLKELQDRRLSRFRCVLRPLGSVWRASARIHRDALGAIAQALGNPAIAFSLSSKWSHVDGSSPAAKGGPERLVGLAAYWGSIALLAIASVLIGVLAAAIAPGASAATLQDFFGLAIQVDASFLLAVFVVASFLLPRLPEPSKRSYGFFLTLDAVILFFGLMIGTLGFVRPELATANAFGLTIVVVLTWFLGLFFLVDGIRLSGHVGPERNPERPEDQRGINP